MSSIISMQNAFNMTHPVIPQGNTFATLEYLASLGIDDNFKIPSLTGLASENYVNDTIESLNIPLLSKITLTNPVITESASISSQTNSDEPAEQASCPLGTEITIAQNISEFIDNGYVSNVNNLAVSADIMIMQNIINPMQNIVHSSCNITKLNETYKMILNEVGFAQIDEITCKVASDSLIIHVKSNSSYPILGSGVIQISVEFSNKTAYKLTIGDVDFNITPFQLF